MGLSDEKALLKALLAARIEVATGGVKSYSIAGRSFSLHSLSELTAEITRCESRIAVMTSGGTTYANMSGPDSAEPIGSAFSV
jgi:hypothetical protein